MLREQRRDPRREEPELIEEQEQQEEIEEEDEEFDAEEFGRRKLELFKDQCRRVLCPGKPEGGMYRAKEYEGALDIVSAYKALKTSVQKRGQTTIGDSVQGSKGY